MNRFIRSLLSIATLALVMLYGLTLKPTLVTWSVPTIILLVYLVMIWVHPEWWTRPRYALSACSVIALYFCIRAINIYKESYRLTQRHVQELAEAHRELQQTHAALQEASVHSMRYAALAERTRLARDMHDGIGHQLTSLIVQLQALEIMLPGDPQQAVRAVPAMLEAARQAMAEVRQAVRAWQEDESGLGLVALQGLISQCAAHSTLALEFQQDGDLLEWPVELI